MAAAEGTDFNRIKVNERYVLGPDGAPVRTENYYVIRALGEVAAVPYLFDTDTVDGVTVQLGGTASPVQQHPEHGERIYGVDIALDAPLEPGDIGELAFTAHFRPGQDLDNEFRRHILAKTGIVDLAMAVQFSADYCPPKGKLWFTDWDLHSGRIIRRAAANTYRLANGDMEAQLNRQHPASSTMVGFTWEL